MSKTLLLWFFLLFNILTYSAYGSTSMAENGDFRTSKQQKEPKFKYGMIMESSKPGRLRTLPGPGLHVVQHTRTVTPNGGGANDNRRPRNGRRSSASSYSIKSSSLFMAALKHLVFGWLLVAFFF